MQAGWLGRAFVMLLFTLGVGRAVPVTPSVAPDTRGAPVESVARGVRVLRQALVTFVYEPGGAFTVTVLDASGANPLPVDKLTLSAISEDNGKPIRANLHAVSDNVYNLDLDAQHAGKPLTGQYLISIRGVRETGFIALTEPNTVQISRLTILVSLALGAPLALGLVAMVWGVLQNRRRELAETPLDLPAPQKVS